MMLEEFKKHLIVSKAIQSTSTYLCVFAHFSLFLLPLPFLFPCLLSITWFEDDIFVETILRVLHACLSRAYSSSLCWIFVIYGNWIESESWNFLAKCQVYHGLSKTSATVNSVSIWGALNFRLVRRVPGFGSGYLDLQEHICEREQSYIDSMNISLVRT